MMAAERGSGNVRSPGREAPAGPAGMQAAPDCEHQPAPEGESTVKPFRFRALIIIDPPPDGGAGRQYASGTRSLIVHARRIDQPSRDKYFPATISQDTGLPLRPGERTVVTITVTDDDARSYFGPGQAFTLWGASGGYGVVSRRVFTDFGPS